MLCLALRIGFGDHRAAQPIASVHQTEETLALAHTHLHLIAFPQTNPERFPVPEIGVYLGVRWWLAHQAAHFLQLFGRKSGGPSGVIALSQTGEALAVEPASPLDQRARRIPKQCGHLFAAHSGSDEQHAVQSMIVTSILMAVDFLLQQRAAVIWE